MLNVNEIKKDFPILSREIDGKKLVYLDNAATSQKPRQVIDAIVDYYSKHNSNVHRGIHTLSEESTELYENARRNIAEFIGAPHTEEVIFTKGATESLNRAAFNWAIKNLHVGDIILTTDVEHHSNLVPWQIVCEKTGAELDYIEIESEFDMTAFKNNLTDKVKLVVITHASNTLGTIFPIKEISKLAKEVGALVVVDGSQAVPHFKVNVQSLDCDMYAFSGHKMLGPMGIGVLWAKRELLEEMAPYEFGGGMIDEVSMSKSTWAKLPEKFEAGTPNVEGAVGMSAAVDYLRAVGMDNIRAHDIELNSYALEKLSKIDGLEVLGTQNPEMRTGMVSFYLKDIHAHDIAAVLNTFGVAVRSGHHCTMPLHKHKNIPASVRASWYLYNSKEDIDVLVMGILKAVDLLTKEKNV